MSATQSAGAARSRSASAPVIEAAVARRAIEAVNWGMPIVNFDLIYQGLLALGGKFNEFVFWSQLSDWKNQLLTPNNNTLYFVPVFSTKEAGPIVIDIPPARAGSITGTIMDCWQAALEDVGPAGLDAGKGGKYLILPPGYTDRAPEGYLVLPSDTYQGFAVLRSIISDTSDAEVARGVAYAKQIALYPLAQARAPPPTVFHDTVGEVFDGVIPYDIRFFRSLDRMVQYEPWLDRDKVMIDVLKTIGIVKDKPFNPDGVTRAILERAAREALAWLDARYETAFPAYFEGTQWGIPAMPEVLKTAPTFYEGENVYSVDARGLVDYYAVSTVKHLGAGQFYLMAIRDRSGRPFDGSNNYRLSVPANVPAKQFWSAVVYDRATHAFIREMPAVGLSSQSPGIKVNADGSTDLYFGAKAPRGRDANWIPARAGGQFEVMFRFYGPDKPLMDKTWQLPDIEKLR